jgi:uncharacterized membrane protein YqhA
MVSAGSEIQWKLWADRKKNLSFHCMNIYSLKLKFILILVLILGTVLLLQTFYFIPKLETHKKQ